MKVSTRGFLTTLAAAIWIGAAAAPQTVDAHCDTLDGPVVKAARAALEKGDVTAVLKWLKNKEDEEQVRTAFRKTLAVRRQSPEAKELADMYFFETVVRLHRAGEGAPYTGLKPAGTKLDPAVAAADKALEDGSADHVVHLVTGAVEAGIRQRFTQAAEKKKHADQSVEAGREFVAAYVEFIHYVERLHVDAATSAGHHEHAEPSAEKPLHEH